MNIRQIIALCKAAGEPADSTAECLSPQQLAAYQDGVLHRAERDLVVAHLADCDRCLDQLAAAARAATAGDLETAVSTSLIARAEALLTPPSIATASRGWRWPVALSAAAAVFLALSLVLDLTRSTGVESERTPAAQTRYADRGAAKPLLLTPAESSLIRPLNQVFQWTEVPGAVFYEVHLVSLDGDPLLRARVDGTRWLIPNSLMLKPGEEYFVRVDAWLNDAKYLSSDYRVFRVEGAR